MAEVREGKRDGTIIITHSEILMGLGYEESWTQLRRELEDVGLPLAAITEHKEHIINWFRVGVATLLLKQKASVDWVNDMGRTPLCIAVKVGAENLCWVLLVSGADPNFCDMFLLDFPAPRTEFIVRSCLGTRLSCPNQGASTNSK
jgi:hypothetical protein